MEDDYLRLMKSRMTDYENRNEEAVGEGF